VNYHWQKVAMVIARLLKSPQFEMIDDPSELVAKRVASLVDTGTLESQGDINNWRHSEVRRAK
jgi:hypothetical protein